MHAAVATADHFTGAGNPAADNANMRLGGREICPVNNISKTSREKNEFNPSRGAWMDARPSFDISDFSNHRGFLPI
jgi:hypothetical protein